MPVPSSANHVILVVEDEGIVRLGAVEAFEEAGFRVMEAFHANHALEFLTRSAADIHALFTDVQMPGGTLDGVALAHRASLSWPWIRILVTSGQDIRHDMLPSGCRFLSKPYNHDHAIGHVRGMLAEVPGGPA
jgi:CheY-like chemotaxis protein